MEEQACCIGRTLFVPVRYAIALLTARLFPFCLVILLSTSLCLCHSSTPLTAHCYVCAARLIRLSFVLR